MDLIMDQSNVWRSTCSRSVPSVRYGFWGRNRIPLGPKHVVIWTKPKQHK